MKTKKSISADIREAIGLAAYHIWEREGRPQGREHIHWHMAEAEILGEQPVIAAAKPAALAKTPKKSVTKKANSAAPHKASVDKAHEDKPPKTAADAPKKSSATTKPTLAPVKPKKTTKSAPRSS